MTPNGTASEIVPSSPNEQLRCAGTRAVLRLARHRNDDHLLNVASMIAGDSPTARALVAYAALRYFPCGGAGFRAAVTGSAAAVLTPSDVIRPLVHQALAPTRVRVQEIVDCLDDLGADHEVPTVVERSIAYASAMLERRYREAFMIWSAFPQTAACLDELPRPMPGGDQHRIAVVMPGPSGGSLGSEIDAHDIVGRIGFRAPEPSQWDRVGKRFDISFLNLDRYRALSLDEAIDVDAPRLITKESCKRLGTPERLRGQVEYGLEDSRQPTSDLAYIPIHICPWCFARGMKPTLYNGDFYLGDDLYNDRQYDASTRLAHRDDVVRSYFCHDVFYCHKVMRSWLMNGEIGARGRLRDILLWNGARFAGALEHRWSGQQGE